MQNNEFLSQANRRADTYGSSIRVRVLHAVSSVNFVKLQVKGANHYALKLVKKIGTVET